MWRWGEELTLSDEEWIREESWSEIFFRFRSESVMYWYDSPREMPNSSIHRTESFPFSTDLCVGQTLWEDLCSLGECVQWSNHCWSRVVHHLCPSKWYEMEWLEDRAVVRSLDGSRRISLDSFDRVQTDEIRHRTTLNSWTMGRKRDELTLLFTSNKDNISDLGERRQATERCCLSRRESKQQLIGKGMLSHLFCSFQLGRIDSAIDAARWHRPVLAEIWEMYFTFDEPFTLIFCVLVNTEKRHKWNPKTKNE